MRFYKGVQKEFEPLKDELSEIEEVYKINRRKFEELKSKNPTERVKDDNELLYYQMRDMFNGLSEKKFSDPLLYFFINKTAYSGMVRSNSKGEFNVPYGRYKNLNTSLVTEAHHKLLQNVEIFNTDYKAVFEMAIKDDFMFLDPPYDCVFSDYGNSEYKDGFTEDDHRELAERYKNLNCKALMVIGRTPFEYSDKCAPPFRSKVLHPFRSKVHHLFRSKVHQFFTV